MANGIRTIENRLAEVLANLPNRFVAVILKFLIQPLGSNPLGPWTMSCIAARIWILEPSAARDRLTAGLYHANDDGGWRGWKRPSCW